MSATSIRVDEAVRERAASLAVEHGVSIGHIVAVALDAYETASFWQQAREALAKHRDALTSDPAWERATGDSLDRD